MQIITRTGPYNITTPVAVLVANVDLMLMQRISEGAEYFLCSGLYGCVLAN